MLPLPWTTLQRQTSQHILAGSPHLPYSYLTPLSSSTLSSLCLACDWNTGKRTAELDNNFPLSFPIVTLLPSRPFLVAGSSWQLPPRPPSPCITSPEAWRAPCSDWSLIFLHSLMVFLTMPTLWIGHLSFSSNSHFQMSILLPSGSLTDTENKQNLLLIFTKQKYNINSYLEVIDLGAIVHTIFPLASIPLWFHSIWVSCENSHLPILLLQSLAVEDNPTTSTLLSIKIGKVYFFSFPKVARASFFNHKSVQCL